MMKKLLCTLLCTAVFLPLPRLFAQEAVDQPTRHVASDKQLDGNYVLTLSVGSKDGHIQELSVLTAVPKFNISSTDPVTTFTGTCTPQGDSTFMVNYAIGRTVAVNTGGNNINYRTGTATASVVVRLGEAVQIIKDGEQIFTLKMDRYKDDDK